MWIFSIICLIVQYIRRVHKLVSIPKEANILLWVKIERLRFKREYFTISCYFALRRRNICMTFNLNSYEFVVPKLLFFTLWDMFVKVQMKNFPELSEYFLFLLKFYFDLVDHRTLFEKSRYYYGQKHNFKKQLRYSHGPHKLEVINK